MRKSRPKPAIARLIKLNGLPGIHLRSKQSDGREKDSFLVRSGDDMLEISFSGSSEPPAAAVKRLRNYPIYLKMVKTFKIEARSH